MFTSLIPRLLLAVRIVVVTFLPHSHSLIPSVNVLYQVLNPLCSLPPPQALTSGVFELKIDSFNSSRRVCRSQSQDCQIFFRVCLKHSQDVINPEPPCTYGSAITKIFGADSNSISQSAPIQVPLRFKWPVGDEKQASIFRSSNTSLLQQQLPYLPWSTVSYIYFFS